VVTVISRFRVRNGLEQEVRAAFLDRPRLVEKTAGFCGLEVLTDAADPAIFLLVTRWTDEASFRLWHRSEAHHLSHGLMPKGLKLDSSFTVLTVGNRIEPPAGFQNLADAIEGRTLAMSQWLMQSDAVFALLLAPDGTIRARNRAADRVFPPGLQIWDSLVCSDADHLRRRLADSGSQSGDAMLLNLSPGEESPITLEIQLIRCEGCVLLVGTQESHHDSQVQNEIHRLTNDLTVMMREAAQKNRELKAANETIERLAGTDALTGLANRRALAEAFAREMDRAERLRENLCVIVADLDHFKTVNDQYGHSTGDQVLMRAAKVFAQGSRPYDLAARYGGEEFLLLLPGIALKSAMDVAERIRKEMEVLEIRECPTQITVSLGVASWIPGETPADLVARADAALYNAKRAGRNRVEAALGVPA